MTKYVNFFKKINQTSLFLYKFLSVEQRFLDVILFYVTTVKPRKDKRFKRLFMIKIYSVFNFGINTPRKCNSNIECNENYILFFSGSIVLKY